MMQTRYLMTLHPSWDERKADYHIAIKRLISQGVLETSVITKQYKSQSIETIIVPSFPATKSPATNEFWLTDATAFSSFHNDQRN